MIDRKPAFIITIDTEPDNQWEFTSFEKTDNVHYIPRFQDLCEKYGFRPVYLTEYNIAQNPFYIDYISEKSASGLCEIGAHPHAWSTPPYNDITTSDQVTKPFITDYPKLIMFDKLRNLIDLLTTTFKKDIVSHRSGRWALTTDYLKILKECGVKIDCSVLPKHFIGYSSESFSNNPIDFRKCPDCMYEMNLDDFTLSGNSGVFEVPMTVVDKHPLLRRLTSLVRPGFSNRMFGLRTLRAEQGNLCDMVNIVDHSLQQRRPYIEFMLHSSELMPRCSPNFPDDKSIEKMYEDLDFLFFKISQTHIGMTLQDYCSREMQFD